MPESASNVLLHGSAPKPVPDWNHLWGFSSFPKRLLCVRAEAALGLCEEESSAPEADPGVPGGQRPHVRESQSLRRSPGSRRELQRASRRTNQTPAPDSGCPALQDASIWDRNTIPDRPEQTGKIIHGRPAGSRLCHRHHLHQDMARLALSGRCDGPVLEEGYWMFHETNAS